VLFLVHRGIDAIFRPISELARAAALGGSDLWETTFDAKNGLALHSSLDPCVRERFATLLTTTRLSCGAWIYWQKQFV
jgi:hypothetical protein